MIQRSNISYTLGYNKGTKCKIIQLVEQKKNREIREPLFLIISHNNLPWRHILKITKQWHFDTEHKHKRVIKTKYRILFNEY